MNVLHAISFAYYITYTNYEILVHKLPHIFIQACYKYVNNNNIENTINKIDHIIILKEFQVKFSYQK